MVTSPWLKALEKQKLEVRSARDALQVKGWLDSGNYALNWAMSGRLLRGYPLGHTVEIFGDPATGKSYLAARAIAMVQSIGGVALLDDTEGGYNQERMERLGVDMGTLAVRRSRTIEEHREVVQAFVTAYRAYVKKDTGPGLCVLDSLAVLSTKHEREEPDKRDLTRAQEIHKLFRVVGGDLLDLPVVELICNHVIANVGNPFQPRTTPGGGAPKYQSSIRLDLRPVSRIKAGADYAGVICRVVVDKNRFVAPWKEARLAIPFERPIARASGLVELLVRLGVLQRRVQFLYHDGKKVGRFYETKERFLDQDALGDQLLASRPMLLEETDAALEAGQLGSGASAVEDVREAEEESDA